MSAPGQPQPSPELKAKMNEFKQLEASPWSCRRHPLPRAGVAPPVLVPHTDPCRPPPRAAEVNELMGAKQKYMTKVNENGMVQVRPLCVVAGRTTPSHASTPQCDANAQLHNSAAAQSMIR